MSNPSDTEHARYMESAKRDFDERVYASWWWVAGAALLVGFLLGYFLF